MKAVRGVRWREIETSWMFWVDRFAKAVYIEFKLEFKSFFQQNLRLVLGFKFCKALWRNRTLKTKYSKVSKRVGFNYPISPQGDGNIQER